MKEKSYVPYIHLEAIIQEVSDLDKKGFLSVSHVQVMPKNAVI